jgi:glycosyltransferase involved in cell wall biosynthesis
VLISTSTFPMSTDDKVTARFVLDLAQHLTAHCRVTVLAPAGATTPSRERWGDVDVRRFQYFWPARLQALTTGEGMVARMRSSRLAAAQAPGFVAAQWWALPRVAREVGADLLNPHWIVPQGFLAAGWARALGLPMVVTAHGADVAWLDRSAWGRGVARRVLDASQGFIADSEELAVRAERRAGRAVPHHAIPMGVSLTRLQTGPRPPELGADDGRPLLLFVGKLVPKKGVDVLLRAVAALREGGLALRCAIIGGGPLEAPLRALSAELGIADRVEFLGWVSNDRLGAFYSAATVVCVPSVRDAAGETEGTPVVLMEALATGALVVASASSGIRDVIRDGENGWLVPPGEVPPLAAALRAALDVPAERRRVIGAAAAATAGEHTWPRVAERFYGVFADAYARVAATRGARR